jgi:hypothetical protein
MIQTISPELIQQAHQDHIINDVELQLLVNTIERERCKSDLFYLANSILNYHDIDNDIHRALCLLTQSVNPLIERLASRASVNSPKSTLIDPSIGSSGSYESQKSVGGWGGGGCEGANP